MFILKQIANHRKHILILSMLAAVTMILASCGNSEIETNMSESVNDFEFTTQDKGTLSNEDLKGEWWIADFIFTNCETVCLPMTSNMSNLQDRSEENNLDVEFVSFSVDPERDTPEVLKNYGDGYDADFSNWTFLTGYDFQEIKELAVKSFKTPIKEAPTGTDQVTHGTRFFLVNPEGEVIKNYQGTKPDTMDDIMEDLKVVAKD